MAAVEWLALQSCCDGVMLQAQKSTLMTDQKCHKSNGRSHSTAILLTPRCAWPGINTLTHKYQSRASGDPNPNPSLLSTARGSARGTGLCPGQTVGARIPMAGGQTPPSLCFLSAT